MTADQGETGWLFTKTLHDSRGRVSAQSPRFYGSVTDSELTRFSYDVLGRVVETNRPGNSGDVVTTAEHHGWETIATDALGRERNSARDARGQVFRVIEPRVVYGLTYNSDSPITVYDYDVFGNRTKIVDSRGNTMQWVSDGLGQRLSTTDPDAGQWSYRYDAAGNRLSTTNPNGAITYRYDDGNRLIGKDLDGDKVDDVELVYDIAALNGVGRLSRIINRTDGVTTTFAYDKRGRPIHEWREHRRTAMHAPVWLRAVRWCPRRRAAHELALRLGGSGHGDGDAGRTLDPLHLQPPG